jgi:hypothetical protein
MTETTNCENCGRVIGALETHHVWEQHVVCGTCWHRLSETPVPVQTLSIGQSPADKHIIHPLAVIVAVAGIMFLAIAGIAAAFIFITGHYFSSSAQHVSNTVQPALKANRPVAMVLPVKQPAFIPHPRAAVLGKSAGTMPGIAALAPKPAAVAPIATLPASPKFALPRPLSLAAADPDVNMDAHTSRQVVSAITRGVNFLLSRENGRHYWNRGLDWTGASERGGETALVLEALIDVDQSLHPPQLYSFSPRMRQALNYLATLQPKATYAASFQAQALTLLPNVGRKKYMAALQRDRRYLFRGMIPGGDYSYTWRRYRGFNWDNSNTQYGVLGLWACAHAGLSVLSTQWRLLAAHWRNTQHIDGSWGYMNDHMHPQSFTPAGVASLFIADEFINAADLNIHRHPDVNIVRGLHWLNTHFNPDTANQYVMYGYERVGLAGGIKYFGSHNWYRDFVRTLLNAQNHDGSWPANFVAPQAGNRIIGTAYSLLILDRGLNPVLMNKLQYSPHFYGQWNARQRDAANITSWLSHEMETPLNWQVVTISSPVSQWLDSPILLITGHKNPHFSVTVLKKLKEYVDAGGMVLCSCDANSRRFRRAMIQAGQACVDNTLTFHPVAADSPLMTMQPWFHIHAPLLGLYNGVRYLWIISPSDMAGVWQSRLHTHKRYWELPLNFYLYATGKGYLANRLHSLTVPTPKDSPARHIAVGRLQFKGQWNPEPGAWPRFAAILAAYDRTAVALKNMSLSQLNLNSATLFPLVDLTGVGTVAFSSADIRHLSGYLNKGGMLFADSAGGKSAFTASCTLLIHALFPGSPLRQVPINSALITGMMPGGINAVKVSYRKYGSNVTHPRTIPQLFGIRRHHRWVVVFSPQDITSGLLGTHTWGIRGYSPRSAQALACNVVMYAIAHRAAHAPDLSKPQPALVRN